MLSAALLSMLLAQGPSPADADALFAKAVRLQQAGDYMGAIAAYQDLLVQAPDRADARSNLGAAYAHLGRYQEAIDEYRRVLAAADAPAVRFNLGLALYKSARTAEAAAEFEKVLAGQPAGPAPVLLLAECRLAMGEDDKVISLLAPLESKYGDDRAFAYLFGTALLRKGDRERGQAVIDRIFRGGDSAEGRLLLGTAHLEAGEFKEAIDELTRAARLNAQLPGVHALLGRALLRAGGRDAALQAFRAELAINPNDFESNLQMGRLEKEDQKYDECVEYLTRARRLRPTDPAPLYVLGTIWAAQQKNEEAQKVLEEVVARSPEFMQAHVLLATVYYRQKRKEDGDRQRQIAEKLEAESEAKEPGAQAGLGPAYRGEPDEPLPGRRRTQPSARPTPGKESAR